MASYEEYLNVLRNGNAILPCYKVEILNENNTTRYVITDDIIADGNLSGKTNNGQRRTATITIFNGHRKYKVAPGHIFYGTKVRLYGGIYVGEEPYYIQLGIFYIKQISSSRGTTTDNITLSLVDKWGKLDGSVFGKVPTRVEYNKSVTKYRNSDVTIKGENNDTINSAALRGNDITIKNNSGTFINPTSGTNNQFTRTGTTGEFEIKYSLSACSFGMSNLANNSQIILTFDNGDVLTCNASSNLLSILFKASSESSSTVVASLNYNVPEFNGTLSFTYDKHTLTCISDVPGVGTYFIKYEYTSNCNFKITGIVTSSYATDIVLSSTSYVINYDYNIYDIIRNTLKKSTRYDIRIIGYIPTEIKSTDLNFETLVNEYLNAQLDDISTVVPNRDYIQLVSDNKIYKCISNDWDNSVKTYVPHWVLVDISYNDLIDNEDPILDSYYEPIYIDENTVQIYGENYSRARLPYGLLTLPKSIVQERGETEGQLLSNLADLLSAEIGYNRYGQLFTRPNGREIQLNEKEVIWRLKYRDYAVLQQKNIDYSNLINYVVVVGNTTDGIELTEYAANEDYESDYCIQKIGVIPYIYKLEYSYNPEDWTPADIPAGETEQSMRYKAIHKNMRELAEWYLTRNRELQSTMSLTCSIIPHIEENKIIEIENAEGKYEKYTIDSFNLPLNFTGTMTMNCTKVV